MRILPLLALFLLVGCAKITLTTSCPSTSTGVAFALSGSTVGNTALSMLATGIATGTVPLKGAALGVVPQGTSATMTYNYFPVFGADSGSLTCTEPPAQTVVVTSPPASVVR